MPVAAATSTDGGTMVLPYTGNPAVFGITLSATLVTAAGSSSKTASPYVSIAGDAALADLTVVAELQLATPAIIATALAGGAAYDSATFTPVVLYPQPKDGAVLTLHFNGATTASAVVTGG